MSFTHPATDPLHGRQSDDLSKSVSGNLTVPTSPTGETTVTCAIRNIFRQYGAQIIAGLVALTSAMAAIVYLIINTIKERREKAEAAQPREQRPESDTATSDASEQSESGPTPRSAYHERPAGAWNSNEAYGRGFRSSYRAFHPGSTFQFTFSGDPSGGLFGNSDPLGELLRGMHSCFANARPQGGHQQFSEGNPSGFFEDNPFRFFSSFFNAGPFGFSSKGGSYSENAAGAGYEQFIQREFPDKDLYAVLGVSRNATSEEIRRAFRKLAMKLHPDKNRNSPDASAKFQELNEANDILKDPAKRARYDREQPNVGRS